MRIDLHMHSNVSDGSLSPSALVRLVHDNGVELMALTDHDTMDGVHLAARTAETLGVGFIPGVEVSTGWGGRVIHIVGLGMDPESAGVDAFFRDVCVKRDIR
ncbi:MAG: PHP domain-containing protein, partial [Sutterella sp.]|nr:PHP domain-containing protein [Sutterella sp.]